MSKDRMISILMPFYNEEKFIEKCVQSIVDQTYKHWELIALDDQSTDSGPAIIKRFAAQDKRVKYFRNPVKGVTHALQMGLNVSYGALITRMDADDIKSPDNLDVLQSGIRNSGIVSTACVKYFSDEEDGLMGGYQRYEDWINSVISSGTCFEHIYRECTIPSPNWMMYRSDLERAGGFRSTRRPEDYELSLRFHKAGLKIATSDKVIHYWRDHRGRVTRNDDRYSDNFFLDLKLPFFLEVELKPGHDLVLLGAGRKAKMIARQLVDRGIPFKWYTNNEKKAGLDIYGVRLKHQNDINFIESDRIIVAVSSPLDKEEMETWLEKHGRKAGENYWWFC